MNVLILACSRAKRRPGREVWGQKDGRGGHPAPAVLVYDGPLWWIVRRHNPCVTVFALSGQRERYRSTRPV